MPKRRGGKQRARRPNGGDEDEGLRAGDDVDCIAATFFPPRLPPVFGATVLAARAESLPLRRAVLSAVRLVNFSAGAAWLDVSPRLCFEASVCCNSACGRSDECGSLSSAILHNDTIPA